jgi:hypothetical protein
MGVLLDLMSSVVAFRVFPSSLSLADILLILVGLVVLWIIISVPVYVAGKVVTAGKASFGDAMVATLFGPVVFLIVLIVVDFFLGSVIGSGGFVLGYVLAFVAWLWVYKVSFGTGWFGALALAVLAVVVFFVMSVVLRIIFGVVVPGPFFPSPL